MLRSDLFPACESKLDEREVQTLHSIEQAIVEGRDINPLQGKGLIRHDVTGKRRSVRTDLLWADWNIHHLHISRLPQQSNVYFAGRSDFLLLTVFFADCALFIDVRSHNTNPDRNGDPLLFAREDLVRTLGRNWPEVLEPYELKGVIPSPKPFSDADRKKLRESGLSVPLTIDGKVIVGPGHGVTSASTPTCVSLALIRFRKNLRGLVELVCRSESPFIGVPSLADGALNCLSLELTPRGIALWDANQDRAWPFPDARFDGNDSVLAEISDALTPPWIKRVLAEVHSSSGSSPAV